MERISRGLLATLIYGGLIVTVLWGERVNNNYEDLVGSVSPMMLIGPVQGFHWALASGALMTPAEYCVTLFAGINVVILMILNFHLQNFCQTGDELFRHFEATEWSIQRSAKTLRRLLRRCYLKHEALIALICEIEAGFAYLITAQLVYVIVNFFTDFPLYFQVKAADVAKRYWLNQISYVLIPSGLFATLLTLSAKNMQLVS